MMKTFKVQLLATIALMTLFVSACSSNNEKPSSSQEAASEQPVTDPMAKYAEPVTLNIGYGINTSSKFPEGSKDTFLDNDQTRLMQDKLNITFTHAFEVPIASYADKVNMLISSNDIPQVMHVTEAQFKVLAESDMLEDMTSAYQNYATPQLKEVIDQYGPMLMKRVTYDGKMLGIPSPVPHHDSDAVVWIRQDWLKNAGIDLPETLSIDDIAKVAKAFIEQDPDKDGKKDTYGLQSTSNFVTPTVSSNTLDAYFTAFKSFPKTWIKDANGNIEYGSIAPETKQALANLSKWYAEGLLDPEFGTIKPEQFAKDLSAGKAGIAVGNSYMPLYFNDSVKNDPKAEWGSYMLTAADGKYYNRQSDPLGEIMVVKKGTAHPEALVKAIDLTADQDNNVSPEFKKPYADSPGTNWSIRPIQKLFANVNLVKDRFKRFQDTASGAMKADQLPKADVQIYESYAKGMDALKASPSDWAYVAYQFLGGKIVLNPNNTEVFSQYYGMTDAMETKWVNLTKLENEAFVQIITGKEPVDYFDTFVSEWKKQGGDEITDEVTQEVKKLNE